MAVKYLATGRLQGTTAERTALTTSSLATTNTSWKELTNGRGTVSGSTATSISTGTFTAKDNLMILFHIIADGSTVTGLHFNDDNSNGNYQKADSDNGAGNSIENGINTLTAIHKTTSYEAFGYGYIRNKLDGGKRVKITSMKNNATGTSGNTTLEQRKYFGVWNPDTATDRITKMTMTAGGANLGVGTEILVLGFDDDEADSGTNYWQQIGEETLESNAGNLDVSISSPKKYMMVNYFAYPDGNVDIAGQCGVGGSVSTGSSDYMKKECDDFGTFGNSVSANILGWGKGSGGSYPTQGIGFMVNVNGSEKMWLSEGMDTGSTGQDSSVYPSVRENAGKFVTTSGQVNIFRLTENGQSGQLGTNTQCIVWGGN